MTMDFHPYPDPGALADSLAARIASALDEACTTRGEAVLAVSGGTTPGRMFEALSRQPIAWNKVTVTLVDERFVPPDNVRSNERLVALKLLQNNAAQAKFVGLYAGTDDAGTAALVAARRIAGLKRPFDVVVLGMGSDGHTASFFPEADRLGDALDPNGTVLVLPVTAPDAGEPRLTLTLPLIVGARLLVLHIEGAEKRAVFEAASQPGPAEAMPVRAVLASGRPVEVFWAP
jgi:6-phosphogluconolactonase